MKAITSIRGRMDLLFISFSLLVIISVGVMYWSITAQREDALVINLAGRQRMLTQKMVWLANLEPENPDLADSIKLFDRTLHALRDGGTTIDGRGEVVLLPPAPDPTLRAQLDKVLQSWDVFREHLQPQDTPALLAEAPLILAQLDTVVSAYEARAEAKVNRLQWINVTFLAVMLSTLVWWYIQTRRRIVHPLTLLSQAAFRMGKGDLDDPVPEMGDDELGELARALETMRAELAASQEALEARVAQLTRELLTAFEFSQEIVSQIEPDKLLHSVVERARALKQAQAAYLCLLMPDSDYLELVASSGEVIAHPVSKQATNDGLALRVVGSGQIVVSETGCANCAILGAQAPGMCAAVPLWVGERTIGALCVVRSETEETKNIHPFDPNGQRALSLLANSAAIAITNMRLVQSERHKAEMAAALAEREQLAADLHDNLAQTLGFLRLKLYSVEEKIAGDRLVEVSYELEHIQSAIETAYQQVRAALVGLSQPQPRSGDFMQKLEAIVADFQVASGLPAELTIQDATALDLPGVTQTQILHIIRESLANVHQHAQAERVWVRVERGNGQAHFTVEDDGIGFDPEMCAEDGHFGLRIMRTRVERTEGEFILTSTPGGGTKITTSYPLPVVLETEPMISGGRS